MKPNKHIHRIPFKPRWNPNKFLIAQSYDWRSGGVYWMIWKPYIQTPMPIIFVDLSDAHDYVQDVINRNTQKAEYPARRFTFQT